MMKFCNFEGKAQTHENYKYRDSVQLEKMQSFSPPAYRNIDYEAVVVWDDDDWNRWDRSPRINNTSTGQAAPKQGSYR